MAGKARGTSKAGAARSNDDPVAGATEMEHASAELSAAQNIGVPHEDTAADALLNLDSDGTVRERGEETAADRDLQRVNKELQVRVRELELQLASGQQRLADETGDYGEASEDSAAVIAVIRDLRTQIAAAAELKSAMETDLASVRESLATEQNVRAEMEARIKLLDAKASLSDQLREDLSFVEEERSNIARRLEQALGQLEQMTTDHDCLAEQKAAVESQVKQLQSDKSALEARVLNLEQVTVDMEQLRQDLAGAKDELQRHRETIQDVKGKMNAAELARSTLEHDLATARETVRKQSLQIDELKASLSAACCQVDEMQAELDKKKLENAHLAAFSERTKRELKALTEQLDSARKSRDESRNALRAIRTAAMRTSSPEPSSTGSPAS